MKLFQYYIVDEDVIDRLKRLDLMESGIRYRRSGDPLLYGYTIDKRTAARFETSRNMKIFHRIVKEGKREELEERKDYLLEIRDASMYFGNDRRFIFPLTGNEIWATENMTEILTDYVQNFVFAPGIIFTKEYADLLAEFDYMGISGVMGYSSREISSDIRANGWKNELMGILFLYGNLINIEGMMEVGEIDGRTGTTSMVDLFGRQSLERAVAKSRV